MAAAQQNLLQYHAFIAIDENASWHKCGIVADGGRSVGCAAAIKFGNQHMFVTAGHVVETCALDAVSFLFRPPGPLVRGNPADWQSRYQEIAMTPRVEVQITDAVFDRQLDIAVLFVSPEIASKHRIRFFDLSSEAVTPPVGTPVLSCGYPTDLALQMGDKDRLLTPFGTIAPIVEHRDTDRLKEFESQQNFLVPYALSEKGHARGFSGAAAWFQKSTLSVWRPNLGLAGICTSYYQPSKMLCFVRIEEIVRFLATLGCSETVDL